MTKLLLAVLLTAFALSAAPAVAATPPPPKPVLLHKSEAKSKQEFAGYGMAKRIGADHLAFGTCVRPASGDTSRFVCGTSLWRTHYGQRQKCRMTTRVRAFKQFGRRGIGWRSRVWCGKAKKGTPTPAPAPAPAKPTYPNYSQGTDLG